MRAGPLLKWTSPVYTWAITGWKETRSAIPKRPPGLTGGWPEVLVSWAHAITCSYKPMGKGLRVQTSEERPLEGCYWAYPCTSKKHIDGLQVLFLPLPGCCQCSTPACIHGKGTYGDVPAAGQCQAGHQVGAQPGLLGPASPEQLNLRSSEARVGGQLFIVQTGLSVSCDCYNEDTRSPWPLMLMGRFHLLFSPAA